MTTTVTPAQLGITDGGFPYVDEDAIQKEGQLRYFETIDAYARCRRRLKRCPNYTAYITCQEKKLEAIAAGTIPATAAQVRYEQQQLTDARLLVALIEEIRNHPYILRWAPPLSQPDQRALFLEQQLATVIGGYRTENLLDGPPAGGKYADEVRFQDFTSQDINIRYGPFGRGWHGASTSLGL